MFKLYKNGEQFMTENEGRLSASPIETAFFFGNAREMWHSTEDIGFIAAAIEGERYLLCVQNGHWPMVLFGEDSLCAELAKGLFENGLVPNGTLGAEPLCLRFLKEYEAAAGGSHSIVHRMDIMRCDRLAPCDTSDVQRAAADDVRGICALANEFIAEAGASVESTPDVVLPIIGSYAVIKENGRIVSMARRARDAERICAISSVHTDSTCRNRGLARKTVSFLTAQIMADGKIPYLYVDKQNPVSNHLYSSIGYYYITPQTEFKYHK